MVLMVVVLDIAADASSPFSAGLFILLSMGLNNCGSQIFFSAHKISLNTIN